MTTRLSTVRVATALVAALAVGAVGWVATEPEGWSGSGAITSAMDVRGAQDDPAPQESPSRQGSADPSLVFPPSRSELLATAARVGRVQSGPAVVSRPQPAPVDRGQQPTEVRIGDIDVSLPVVALGVDEAGAMAIPGSSFEAGWYQYGSAAGASQGAVVVAAHVSSKLSGPGPFARLVDLRPGSVVELDTRDGTVRYEVVSVERTPKRALDTSWLFDRGSEHRLHLVTCGGRFDRKAGHYEDNVVVVARPLG